MNCDSDQSYMPWVLLTKMNRGSGELESIEPERQHFVDLTEAVLARLLQSGG
jgi:hypothetical protein